MTKGLPTTFRVLAETKNEAAVSVLIPALDAPDPTIEEGALRALLKRRSPAGQREILGRLHTISDRWKTILGEGRGRLSVAIRDAILGTDPQMFANACQAALWFAEYDLTAALINVGENSSHPHAAQAAETVLELSERLYQELTSPRDYRERRDPQLVRRHVVTSLENSVKRYPTHKCDRIVEAFLVLAKRDNAVLRKIMQDPHDGSYRAILDVLAHSDRPAVLHLLLSFLDDAHAPSAAISILAHRGDAWFIEHLLQHLGNCPSDAARQNVKRLTHFAWLRNEPAFLNTLDDHAQSVLVHLVLWSGMKRLEAFETVRAVMKHGKCDGRRAACEALAEFSGADANRLVEEALGDEDPMVQAAALVQIRQRGIPNAMTRLIQMVENPHEEVREAARGQLEEFSLERYLSAFDALDDQVRRTTGALVLKVDPGAISGLAEEMQARARSRRLRALAAVQAMDAARHLEASIVELVHDEDHMVRTEAARALGACDTATARQALAQARVDRSVAVQTAAQQSLLQLDQGQAPLDPPTGVT